jgi:flotillin
MQHASIIDMVVQKLPDIAKEIASPLNQVDSITLYDPQGTTKLVESGTRNMEQVLQVAKQCGIDLPDLINNFVKKPNTSDTSKSSAKKSSPEGNC